MSRWQEPPLRRRPLTLSGESRHWARERSLAEAHDCRTNSAKALMYIIGELVSASTSSYDVRFIDENGNDLTLATFAP